MQKVITSSNLNPPLKLFFYSLILTNNNLLLKIYCKNIVVVFFNQDFLFFILFFFLSFHFHPYTFHFFFSFFFFLFLVFLLHTSVQSLSPLLLFSFSPQEHSSNLTIYFTSKKRERERERETAAHPPSHHHWRSRSLKGQSWWRSVFTMQHYHIRRPTTACPSPHLQAGSDQLVLFFLFSYLLVLIQLYFKNWILFCVLCLDYLRNEENERKKEIQRREKELI